MDDIERLNKSQIVLLTLLVSFVTSIATGIVTVSLMEQAPPAIAQTVNRVIERTVETVTPSDSNGQAAATVVTQEKTIVVKETDLISQAVQKVAPSLVRIYEDDGENAALLALGVVIDNKGSVVTDSSALTDSDFAVSTGGATRVRMFVHARDEKTGLAFLQPATSSDAQVNWQPAVIASDQVVLGSTVVGLAGKTATRILPGIVTAIPESAIIDTDLDDSFVLPGTPIMNADGSIVGVSTSVSRASSPSGFLSSLVLLPQQ